MAESIPSSRDDNGDDSKDFDDIADNVDREHHLAHTPSPPVALEMELEDADDESFSDASSERAPVATPAISPAVLEQEHDKGIESQSKVDNDNESFESLSEDIQEEFEDDFDDDFDDDVDEVIDTDKEDKERSTNNISGLSDPSFSFAKDVSVSQESDKSNESEAMVSRQTSVASDYEIRYYMYYIHELM